MNTVSKGVDLLVRKLRMRDRVSDDEVKTLCDAIAREREFAPGDDLVREGDRPWESTLVVAGFTGRYRLLRDGSRQITAVHVPGDFIDLHSFVLKRMDHGIVALSECRTVAIPHDALQVITERLPHLTRLLWLSTVIDGSIHREWIVAMGRRNATGQIAHLVCEMFLRLRSVDLVNGDSFRFPITQLQLSDMMGLSSVHVNRVIQELRGTGLLRWEQGTVTIANWQGLTDLAEFDPTYLNLEMEPR